MKIKRKPGRSRKQRGPILFIEKSPENIMTIEEICKSVLAIKSAWERKAK